MRAGSSTRSWDQPAGRGVRGAAVVPRILCRGRPVRGAGRPRARSAAAADDERGGRRRRRRTSEETFRRRRESRPKEEFDPLAPAWFVPAREIGHYTDAEKLFGGEPRLYRKGTFIYRLAGREREKSASYYTPEVLTQCLVKHALKELLQGRHDSGRHPQAHRVRAGHGQRGVPERSHQPAGRGVPAAQAEGAGTDHSARDSTPKRSSGCKMYIADTNVFGVDLNPVAVELAEVSLWLNAIFDGRHVPWFGMQLYDGQFAGRLPARCVLDRLAQPGQRRQGQTGARLARAPCRSGCWRRTPSRKRRSGISCCRTPAWPGAPTRWSRRSSPRNMELLKQWRKKFNEPLRPDEINACSAPDAGGRGAVAAAHRGAGTGAQRSPRDELHVWPDKRRTGRPRRRARRTRCGSGRCCRSG